LTAWNGRRRCSPACWTARTSASNSSGCAERPQRSA
jgi:hypothetical protein